MAAVVNDVISTSYGDALANTLRQRKFSVLADESTDICCQDIIRCCKVLWWQNDENKQQVLMMCQVFDREDCENANQRTDEKKINSIMKTFREHNIPTRNMVDFAFDGWNVMMGSKNSVASRLKNQCPCRYNHHEVCSPARKWSRENITSTVWRSSTKCVQPHDVQCSLQRTTVFTFTSISSISSKVISCHSWLTHDRAVGSTNYILQTWHFQKNWLLLNRF